MTVQTVTGVTLAAGLVPALAGPSGVGKTAMLADWAAATGRQFAVLELSQCDPTDLAGLPVPTPEGVVHRQPLQRLADLVSDPERSLLLLDDLSAATPATQTAALRLLLHRQTGDLTLPDRAALAVAYNPADQDGLFALEPTVAGRLLHIDVTPDAATVAEGLRGNWPPIPVFDKPDDTMLTMWKRDVAAFLLRRPALVLSDAPGPAAPSPRTWEMAATAAATADAAGVEEEALHATVAAAIGLGAAAEFLAWRREQDLPEPAAMLANPDSAPPVADTDRPDRTLLIAEALVDTALDSGDADWVAAAWKLLGATVGAGQGDVVLPPARRLTTARRPGSPIPEEAEPLLDLLAAA